MYKSLNRPREGLERDAAGHRTGFKLMLKMRRAMRPEAFSRWGIRQRQHISKHKYVWVYYASTRAIGMPNGVPIEIMANNRRMGEFLVNTFLLQNNETYAIHGWTNGKTRFHCKLTRCLAIIDVLDVEGMKFNVRNDGRLGRYAFRTTKKRERREVI